jgi:hypothetical protein
MIESALTIIDDGIKKDLSLRKNLTLKFQQLAQDPQNEKLL